MPRPVTSADVSRWGGLRPMVANFTGPGEQDAGIAPCQAIVTDDAAGDEFGRVVRVPWTLSPEDLAQLAAGGTLWLSTWGGLPIHMIEVGL